MMLTRTVPALTAALALALSSPGALAARFVYEGRLDDLGQPANGRYDLRLTAYGDAKRGASLAAPVSFEGVEVQDGRFRLDVELPLVASEQVWLEVAVRAAGEPVFANIPGRSKAIAAPLIGACWSTTGDSGSNPATNFIGTTDAQPFVVRTNNSQNLRIEPSTVPGPNRPNIIAGSGANFVSSGIRGATIAGGGTGSGAEGVGSNPNAVTGNYGAVGGGHTNVAGVLATISGGLFNSASGERSTVGGGNNNTASGTLSTVGGGQANTASGNLSTVGGGTSNIASNFQSTVGGGISNTASGERSTVGGGNGNTASGERSTVSGGSFNCAGGDHSWAGGQLAKVRPAVDPGGTGACAGLGSYPGSFGDQGTFVWADSQIANFVSTGSNQFLVRAQGGIFLGTAGPVSIPSGRFINTSSGAHLTSGGTWTNASSRAIKAAFEAIDPVDVLRRLLSLPVSRWQYRESPAEGVHLGPVAEDFHAAFGLGADTTAISTVDATGVALAAIQGLNQKLEVERDALAARVEALDGENAELRARLERLEARLDERLSGER